VAGVNSVVLWYTARGTGAVMLVLFTLALVLGIVTRGGRPLPGLPRFAVAGLHRNISLLAIAFLAIHIITIVTDSYSRVGWLATVIPFIAGYRALWVGLGTIAFDVFLAVIATSLLRARIGHRVWRLVHWAAYAAWPSAVLHGMFAGTDNTAAWMIAIDLLVIGAVLAAVGWRLTDRPRWRRAAPRLPAAKVPVGAR
jgi:sulfoxide reductase heme-binding subunit YedZ